MNLVTFVLLKNLKWLSRPYHLKFFKGCLPHILLGSLLNTLSYNVLTHFSEKSWPSVVTLANLYICDLFAFFGFQPWRLASYAQKDFAQYSHGIIVSSKLILPTLIEWNSNVCCSMKVFRFCCFSCSFFLSLKLEVGLGQGENGLTY